MAPCVAGTAVRGQTVATSGMWNQTAVWPKGARGCRLEGAVPCVLHPSASLTQDGGGRHQGDPVSVLARGWEVVVNSRGPITESWQRAAALSTL